jgi:hypothetical protein
MHASPRPTIRLAEAAWLLQETVNATRRLCRQGHLQFIQHGKCIEIPAEELRRKLRSTRALAALEALVIGQLKAPRVAKPSDPPASLRRSDA